MRLLTTERYKLYPYLHWEPDHVFNPLTDVRCNRGDELYRSLRVAQTQGLTKLSRSRLTALKEGQWIFPESTDTSLLFKLRFAEVETTSACNQSCYFCPVSVAPRTPQTMSLEFFEKIVEQLSAHRETLRLVNLFRYNEPTLDKRLVKLVEIVRSFGLPPGINTNASGLSPKKIDQLGLVGGFRFLSINLSTLSATRYRKERGHDHLATVLKNLDYLSRNPIADRIDLAVLGRGDTAHKDDFKLITERFSDSPFNVSSFQVMDRGGNVNLEGQPEAATFGPELRGCMQTGSRPVQWVHITPEGQCVICCQDYHEKYVVGDLKTETLDSVLKGPKFAQVRDWAYGVKPSPDDFICKKCVFARFQDFEDSP